MIYQRKNLYTLTVQSITRVGTTTADPVRIASAPHWWIWQSTLIWSSKRKAFDSWTVVQKRAVRFMFLYFISLEHRGQFHVISTSRLWNDLLAYVFSSSYNMFIPCSPQKTLQTATFYIWHRPWKTLFSSDSHGKGICANRGPINFKYRHPFSTL